MSQVGQDSRYPLDLATGYTCGGIKGERGYEARGREGSV